MDPGKTVRAYTHIPEEQATALIAFLREEWEIFAWCPADMLGIPREFAELALHIKANTKPVKQALRRFLEPKCRETEKKSTDYSTPSSSEKRRRPPGLPTQC